MANDFDQQFRSFESDETVCEAEDNEVERYELREPPRYHFSANRREFTQSLGLGVLLVASMRPVSAQRRRGRSPRREESFSQRFHLGADGMVTVLTGKVDVGQGSRTQIAQAAAEELRLDIDRVDVVMADSERCPDDGGTAGSRTTPSTIPRVQNSAAALRELLVQVVAERFATDREHVTFDNGVFRSGDAKRLTLAELAGDDQLLARLNRTPPADAKTTPVDQWKVLGTSVPRIGGRDVVTGQAKYPSDIQLPGMLYGKVLRPVSYGAELTSIDIDAADLPQDINVVRDGSFVGCVAATSWQAQQACDALSRTCQWSRPQHPSSDELFDHLRRTARSGSGRDQDGWGAGPAALSDCAFKLEASYTIAYVQHAPMEPRAAVADWSDGKLTVWTGTQQPSRVHGELCQIFRLPNDRVRLIAGKAGGGFGGKHTGEAAIEAARLSKAVGKPVSLRWTRAEELTWAYFRPAGIIDVKAGIDADGRLHTWEFTNYNSGG